VWTIYASDLELDRSDFVLINSYGSRIYGSKTFLRGEAEEGIGNFTYTLTDGLPDGNYTMDISIVDEFGNEGEPRRINFIVNKALPVIYLESPIVVNTNSIISNSYYHTNNSFFHLIGRIESSSELIEASYSINKGSGFQEEQDLDLNNGYFDMIITLDSLREGSVREYVLKLRASNAARHHEELIFNIIHDKQAPLPVEVRIE
jgi:hypothetical protein